MNGEVIHKRTMKRYFRNETHEISFRVSDDPCLYNLGNIELWIGCQLWSYARVKPIPNYVEPIPILLLH